MSTRKRKARPGYVEPIYRRIGEKIRNHRELRGMSQAELGLALRPPLTRAAIANIEAANQRIYLHTILQIGRTLRVDLTDIVMRVDMPARHSWGFPR